MGETVEREPDGPEPVVSDNEMIAETMKQLGPMRWTEVCKPLQEYLRRASDGGKLIKLKE